MIIDSHVNLHAPQFDEDRDAVIARAREAGVQMMVEISDKLSTFEATHGLAMAHDDIWCTVLIRTRRRTMSTSPLIG
jgi:TatD DNase family protein